MAQCSVEIKNNSSRYILTNPSVYQFGTTCEDPIPPKLFPSSSGTALFTTCGRSAFGSVFQYDLISPERNDQKMSMFVWLYVSNENGGTNYHTCWLTNPGTACNEELYKLVNEEHAKGVKKAKAGCFAVSNHESSGLNVAGTMSENRKAILKVDVSDAIRM